ncbi:AsnC-type helix-turn-helix domain-containing protein [Alkalibacterium subtropicum]|uniref:AsnC-type helix-turn-helix domain-containing protein n=1 Tax=Alkalibacterium subtropicum TaxID=753702 RepID=A0A1I1IAM2_9LACT|nr:Lrp/AsnC family transcriptional regulator [Alkalibacterium subtropicum]SFC33247.1 AsnC-type helix-turn-helix domain-containing protein [Alkalibacterium subtropicum]
MAKKEKNYDQTDYKIIQELSKDARKSVAKIARKIDVNERTVRRRIEKLIQDNTLRITTIVDPSSFGYNAIADINLKVDEAVYDDFVEECKADPNVCYIATGWGKANLSIETRFLDNENMYDFINKTLPETAGVEVINYFIIPKIIYNIDEWLPVKEDFKEE